MDEPHNIYKDHIAGYNELAREEAGGEWTERRRLAAAMRKVIGRLIEIDAPESELAAAADRLERYSEHLASHPRSRRYEGFHEAAAAGNPAAFFDHSPLIGHANPLAPPIVIHAAEEGARVATAEVFFGPAYEGPPGCVHGGFVAAAFDEVLGYVNTLSGAPGMTAHLEIDYRRPTPLLTPLRFESELVRIDGRKKYTRGAVYAGETLTAEAEALFISIDLAKVQDLRSRREALTEADRDAD